MARVHTSHVDSENSAYDVDILIITALPEERDAVLRQLPSYQPVQDTDFPTFNVATLETDSGCDQGNLVVAVTMLRHAGNVFAAVHTARFLQRFKPHYVLMIGIAGGVEGKVHLGDVVISDQIIYYEITKEQLGFSEQRPQVLRADWLLLDRAKNYTDISWHANITAERPATRRNVEVPRVHCGPIASGEKVIADRNRITELKQQHSKLHAVDMESFGVGLTADEWADSPQFIAVRGISDYANEEKNDKWHEYASDSAAAFSVAFLRFGALPLRDNSPAPSASTLIAIRHQSLQRLPTRLTEATLPEVLMPAKLVHVELDQTDLYDYGRLTDPVEAVRRQTVIVDRLSEVCNSYPDAELAYYGIAHIPLLFHIGYQVLTRIPVHFFEHNRTTHRWDYLHRSGDYPQIRIAGLPDVVSLERGDVIVRISISYLVTSTAIEGIVTNPIASLHLSINEPKRDSATSMSQIEQYSVVFRDLLDEIHKLLPNTERVHVFYAGPVALAVNLGRQISNTIHSRIIVYNYSPADNPPGYAWGLEITADVDSPGFMTRVGG